MGSGRYKAPLVPCRRLPPWLRGEGRTGGPWRRKGALAAGPATAAAPPPLALAPLGVRCGAMPSLAGAASERRTGREGADPAPHGACRASPPVPPNA